MKAICRGCPGMMMGDCATCDAAWENEREDYGEDGDREEPYAYGEAMQTEPTTADLETAGVL